jgi:Glycosyltransferase family 87
VTLAVALGSAGVLVAASVLAMVLAFAEKVPCRAGAWNYDVKKYQDFCYTDIYPLYYTEGLYDKQVPYSGHPVEYPVLIGGAMQAVAWLVRNVDATVRGREFYDLTAILLALCAVAAVLATARAAGPGRRWQALLVALSPALILNAFVNWDLIAMALTALGIAAWATRRGVWAGVLLGLAVATKFYPLVVLGALLLLCLRAGRLREFAKTFAAAALAWLAVNVPVMIAALPGWATFYIFSQNRGADWGSVWYMFEYFQLPRLGNYQLSALNEMSGVALVVTFAAIALLALAAPVRPRLPQVCFLLLAAFLMTNKVWSPQYVIWLVPLAVLARPRLWPYLLWQLAEIGYFFGIWAYLIFQERLDGQTFAGYQGLSTGWYFTLLAARFLTVALLAAYVVRDILYPERDVVRAEGLDDPAGGVLDHAPDRFRIRIQRGRPLSVGLVRAGGLGAQLLLQPADVGGQPAVLLGCLADHGGARGPDHAEQQRRVDRPRRDVGVPVPPGAELVA